MNAIGGSTPHRLSILVPGQGARARLERCVQSLVRQNVDPIGTEVIVAAPESAQDLLDYFRSAFPEAFFERRLRVIEARGRAADSRLGLWRAAAEAAEGAFLALVDPRDRWRPGALQLLGPHLYGNDLVLGAEDETPAQGAGADWVRALLERNFAAPSSGLIRRTLWERVLESAPEAASPLWAEEYSLWLSALLELQRHGHRERFAVLPQRGPVEPRSDDTGQDPWLSALPVPWQKIETRVARARETASALRLARRLPLRYWPSLGRRLKPGRGKDQ